MYALIFLTESASWIHLQLSFKPRLLFTHCISNLFGFIVASYSQVWMLLLNSPRLWSPVPPSPRFILQTGQSFMCFVLFIALDIEALFLSRALSTKVASVPCLLIPETMLPACEAHHHPPTVQTILLHAVCLPTVFSFTLVLLYINNQSCVVNIPL